MKKFLPLVAPALLLLLCPQTHAQGVSRQAVDNFDLAGGVALAEPVAPPAAAPAPATRRLRMTAMHRAELERSRAALGAAHAASPANVKAAPVSRATLTAPFSAAKGLDRYTTGDPNVDSLIAASGTRNGVDPVLLYAIMHRESAFKKRALSHKGARGLMQLMPGTAARFGVRDIFDPAQNIEGGARYMSWLLRRFDGDVRLALAGYNAGEGAVDKYGRRVPPYRETQEYVRRISERYSLMRDPEAARRAPVYTASRAAAANQSAEPSPVYERNAYSVRLPDGKLMLVNQ